MSHGKERSDKICLNCNAVVYGRHCHVCGQENIEVKERFREVVLHLIYDITHFDSKFFDTLRYLLFRPGYLSYEYLRGRRNRYLHPIKMYVFISALYFVSLALLNKEGVNGLVDIKQTPETRGEIVAFPLDSNTRNSTKKIAPINKSAAQTDSLKLVAANKYTPTLKDYIKKQDSLPVAKRDRRFRRYINTKMISAVEKSGGTNQLIKTLLKDIFQSLPKVMFVLLPIYALLMQLLYVRRPFYYVQHIIFIIHATCAFYIINLLDQLTELNARLPYIGGLMEISGILLSLYLLYYGYAAMRFFYRQSRLKTILKYSLFIMAGFVISTIILLLAGFVLVFFKF